MKNTGMTRKVDGLGRIVVPKEIRSVMDIKLKDPMEVFIDGDSIVFRKYHASDACMVTGKVSDDNVSLVDGTIVLSKDILNQVYKEIENKFK